MYFTATPDECVDTKSPSRLYIQTQQTLYLFVKPCDQQVHLSPRWLFSINARRPSRPRATVTRLSNRRNPSVVKQHGFKRLIVMFPPVHATTASSCAAMVEFTYVGASSTKRTSARVIGCNVSSARSLAGAVEFLQTANKLISRGCRLHPTDWSQCAGRATRGKQVPH